MLSRLSPLILAHQGKGTMSAVRLGPKDPPQKLKVGDYTLEASFLIPPGSRVTAAQQENLPYASALFIQTGPDEYIVAGTTIRVVFAPNTPGLPFAGLGTVEEGTFVNGRWVPGRQLAGDDTGQGDFLGLWGHSKSAGWPADATEGQNLLLRDMTIERVTLYRYR
jgi:hypothetical protein